MEKKVSPLNYLLLEPLRKGNFSLAFLRCSMSLSVKTNGQYDKCVHFLAKMFKPAGKFRDDSQFASRATLKSIAESAKRDGWCILPFTLSNEDIASLREFIYSVPAYAENPQDRIIVSDTMANPASRYMWRIEDVLSNNVVQKLIRDSALHYIAQEYLECTPILTSISVWYDLPSEKPAGAFVFHFDNDGPKFVKFFCYLEETSEESGAHVYMQRTHDHTKPKDFKMAKRFTDKDVVNKFGKENMIKFTGPAGTMFVEDTAGFHRGTPPRSKPRMILQFQYSIVDIPHFAEDERKTKKPSMPGVDPHILRIARKFIRK